MPRVYLTGGSGFVGAHVARALAARGWRIRALSRRAPGAPSPFRDLPVEVTPGDLSGSSNLEAGISECDAVVHVAGLVKGRNLEEYREVNLRGTERLLAAARRAVPDALFLLVSTQAAAGPAIDGRPVRETDPARPISWYGISKREGELAVAREWRGPWIVLRPAVVYGPGDRGLLVLFRWAARGLVPVPAASSRIQLVSAERAAEAIARAASARALAGRTGFVSDAAPVAIGELASRLASLAPRPARLLRVPRAVVRAAGALETIRERVTGRSRPFNADKARELLAGDWLCDPEPMASDLGLPPPTPLEDGLRRTWDWYVREGWLCL